MGPGRSGRAIKKKKKHVIWWTVLNTIMNRAHEIQEIS
jgi:hypothetical protein